MTAEFSRYAALPRRAECTSVADRPTRASIWKSFVPFHSYQVFQRGGYYSVEVIPGALAVISLNTMYLFDSNKGASSPTLEELRSPDMSPWRRFAAVGGCEPKSPQDPGNLQLDWLEVQLKTFRSRNMQVGERVY